MNRLDRNSRSSVEVVAHRGASALAPENTLGAVRRAWELGADAVEVDVHLSADRQLVVIHDETLERTSRRCECVADLTAEELSQVDVGSWFGDEWASERVSTLRQILDTVPNGKRLFVELKCGSGGVDALAEPLAEVTATPQKVALIGFGQELMGRVKTRYPAHEIFLVARQKFEGEVWRPSIEELIEAAATAGLDGLNLLNTLAVNREAVNQIHEAGLSCGVWVINSLEDAQRLIEAEVESLTMDDPGMLRT